MYYAKIKKLWEEIANYEQLSIGNCEKTELAKRHEKENLLQFLFGLDTAMFGSIRSSILNEDPLPNVNQAYAKIVQEEHVKLTKEDGENINGGVVFVVRNFHGSNTFGVWALHKKWSRDQELFSNSWLPGMVA